MDVAMVRKEVKAFRNELSAEKCKELSNLVCKNIELYLEDNPSFDTFLCYFPLEKEVDLRPLYEKLLSQNKSLYFPKTKEDGIFFYKVTSLDEFVEGKFHVMEPISEEEPYIKNSSTICFVPGLAFSRKFHRIGYGGGYYDRFLKSYKVLKIGTCFEQQIMDIAPKSHDVDMDVIINNCEIIKK